MSLTGIMQTRIFSGKISIENLIVFMLHGIAWLVIFLVPQLFENRPSSGIPSFSLILNFTGFVVFYLNYFFLTPQFLLQRKHFQFFLAVFVVFLFVLFVVEPFLDKIMKENFARNFDTGKIPYDFKKLQRPNEGMPPVQRFEARKYLNLIFLVTTYMTFSSAIRIFQKLKKEERINQLYRNEKLRTELIMFRQQVNPHFLFNSLNNIQSLANSHSPKTTEAISKLSSILRYMLNESKNDQISLSRELDMITDYIEFQKLRFKDRIEVKCICEKIDGDYFIEPFILNPLVENAFKHGVFPGIKSKISIRMEVKDGWLNFYSKNAIANEQGRDSGGEGIGIKNVIKRLELSYPNAFEFNQKIEKGEWIVRLKLKLRKQSIRNNRENN